MRLVAQGFLQQEGIDNNEIFAPVVDSTSMSLLLAIANQRTGFDIVLVHEHVEHIKDVVAQFNKQVKPFEMIRKVFLVDEIPKTDLHKIMYVKLEEMIKEMPFEKI